MHRLRVKFSCGEELKYISHLDLMRCWERALRRAGLAIAYSEGFTPHPRFSLAAPLPVGMTSQTELMDLFLTEWLAPDTFRVQMRNQLPAGLVILETMPIGLTASSLQSQMRFAEYEVVVFSDKPLAEIQHKIQDMLDAREISWQHIRDKVLRSYNLRAMIDDIRIVEKGHSLFMLGMRLRCDSTGTGRPEQVVKALDFPQYPRSINRTNLILH